MKIPGKAVFKLICVFYTFYFLIHIYFCCCLFVKIKLIQENNYSNKIFNRIHTRVFNIYSNKRQYKASVTVNVSRWLNVARLFNESPPIFSMF